MEWCLGNLLGFSSLNYPYFLGLPIDRLRQMSQSFSRQSSRYRLFIIRSTYYFINLNQIVKLIVVGFMHFVHHFFCDNLTYKTCKSNDKPFLYFGLKKLYCVDHIKYDLCIRSWTSRNPWLGITIYILHIVIYSVFKFI